MQETEKEEKAAPLMSGSGSRYLAVNCCASCRVEVIFCIHVIIDLSCITEMSLCIKFAYTALCITSKSSHVLSFFSFHSIN